MATLSAFVMGQATEVIEGLQATVARLQGELESARQSCDELRKAIEVLREENRKLAAKTRRQSGALHRERKAATWQQ